MVVYVGLLTVAHGKREEYLHALLRSGMIETFRGQEGNVYYQVAASATDEDVVVVTDGWQDRKTFEAHDGCALVKDTWMPLAQAYVTQTKSCISETAN